METNEGETATYTYDKGKIYVGSYKAGKKEGLGKMTFVKGHIYEGPFVKNKMETKEGETATYTFKSGHVYVGEYKAGKREGQGAFTYSTGDKYEGTFAANKFNGEGTYTDANGNVKSGNWVNGELEE